VGCHLGGNKALLLDSCEPNLGTIGQYRYDKCIVYMVPVYEVETPDRVSQNTNAPDGGVCAVHHNANVFFPLKVGSDEDPQVMEQGDGCDVVELSIVRVLGTPDLTSNKLRLA